MKPSPRSVAESIFAKHDVTDENDLHSAVYDHSFKKYGMEFSCAVTLELRKLRRGE